MSKDILIEKLIFLITALALKLTLNSDTALANGHYRIISGIYSYIYATVNAVRLLD